MRRSPPPAPRTSTSKVHPSNTGTRSRRPRPRLRRSQGILSRVPRDILRAEWSFRLPYSTSTLSHRQQQHHHHQSSYHRLRRLWYTRLYNLSSSFFPFRFIIFSSSCRLVHGAFFLLFLFLFLITSFDSKKIPFVVTYVGSTYYLDIMLTTPLAYFAQASGSRFSSSSSSSSTHVMELSWFHL